MADYVRTSSVSDLAAAIAAVPVGGVVVIDKDVSLTAPYTVKKSCRIEGWGGAINGSGVRYEALVRTLGVKVRNANNRGMTWGPGASESVSEDDSVDGAGDRGMVAEKCSDVTFIRPDTTNTVQHGIWDLAAIRSRYIRPRTHNCGHQGMELNHSVDAEVDDLESWGNASLGLHMLVSTGAQIRRPDVHDNKNNGIDTNGSSDFQLIHPTTYRNGSKGAQDQEGGSEGTGILLYQAHDILVTLPVSFNNAQGQPNNRDGISVVGSAKTPTYNVKIIGAEVYDDQATHTQRYGVGLMAKVAGQVHDVTLLDTHGFGNLGGLIGRKNVDDARDHILIAA